MLGMTAGQLQLLLSTNTIALSRLALLGCIVILGPCLKLVRSLRAMVCLLTDSRFLRFVDHGQVSGS